MKEKSGDFNSHEPAKAAAYCGAQERGAGVIKNLNQLQQKFLNFQPRHQDFEVYNTHKQEWLDALEGYGVSIDINQEPKIFLAMRFTDDENTQGECIFIAAHDWQSHLKKIAKEIIKLRDQMTEAGISLIVGVNPNRRQDLRFAEWFGFNEHVGESGHLNLYRYSAPAARSSFSCVQSARSSFSCVQSARSLAPNDRRRPVGRFPLPYCEPEMSCNVMDQGQETLPFSRPQGVRRIAERRSAEQAQNIKTNGYEAK